MNTAWFLTGTDTGVGKTLLTCAFLHLARSQGKTALAMKPVAAGVNDCGENEDVVALLAAGSLLLPPRQLNPYLLHAPIAPHIAAVEEGVVMQAETIRKSFSELLRQSDVLIVEGVGGFRVPLMPAFDSADLAQQLALPVILVVGMRLGCLNHALLTVEAIENRGLALAGWVANQIDPHMLRQTENIDALENAIKAPLLGRVPHQRNAVAADVATFLQLPVI